MNGGPSGFNNAPVTKAIVISSTLFTIFFGFQGRSHKLGLSYQVFILFSYAVSFFLESSILALLKDPGSSITTGPYSLIFSAFVPFFFDIPVSTRFRVLGLKFSDKSFIYLAGLQILIDDSNNLFATCGVTPHNALVSTMQLLLSSWKRSILPGICGVIAGFLYRTNIFSIRKAKLPYFLTSLFSRVSWPSTGSPSSSAGTRNTPSITSVAPYAGRQRNYPSPIVGSMEPSEDSITMLVSMGFDRDNARQALAQARNDINVATNILLEAHSH
ncbi:hypothetical protein KSS87_005329 [Heliosperma pusillum]|nr:hypothetical protein KSS87_005329 [Heliosperma pusillum]